MSIGAVAIAILGMVMVSIWSGRVGRPIYGSEDWSESSASYPPATPAFS